MAEIITETGKKWLRDFEGSKKAMKARIIAIEEEIRRKVEEEHKNKK